LKLANCDFGQGYFFSRPVPCEEFERLLKEGFYVSGAHLVNE